MESLPLFDGMLNASVIPEDELRLSGQCMDIYKRLLQGSATNVELIELTGACAPSARRSDVRAEVRKYGWDLRLVKKHGRGVNEYALIRPDGKEI